MNHAFRQRVGLQLRCSLLPQRRPKRVCATSSATTNPTIENNSGTLGERLWKAPSVIDVAPLAQSLRSKVREYTKQHQNVRLVGILAGDQPELPTGMTEAEVYSEKIALTLREDGLHYDVRRTCSTSDEQYQSVEKQLQTLIQDANAQSQVHGILVFYPIFARSVGVHEEHRLPGVYYKTQDDYYRDLVSSEKDVEGLCGTRRWFHHTPPPNNDDTSSAIVSDTATVTRRGSKLRQPATDPLVYPCTARSVQCILEQYHLPQQQQQQQRILVGSETRSWEGQVVSIINRSEIVGRPLASMLANQGATVYSIDAHSILHFSSHGQRLHRCASSRTLKNCLEESHVVVTGVPCPDFCVPVDWLRRKEGTTLVNVSEFCNVDEAAILEHPHITYIPQVGKVTLAVLEHNLVRLHQHQQQQVSCADPTNSLNVIHWKKE